jgi:type I restriction enzyme S subunit
MESKWPKVKLEEMLEQNTTTEELRPDESYKLLGVRLEGKGPFIREEKLGSQIRAKRLRKVTSGEFIYSRLFAWRGAFGLISPEMDCAFVSNEFPTFKIDETRVFPKILEMYFKQRWVWNDVEKYCTGTTKASRNRFKEKFFLNLDIPLPAKEEQKCIVAKIENLMTMIEEARKLRSKGISNAETLLFTSLSHFFDYSLNDKLPIGWNWQPFKALLINDKEGLVTGPFGTLLQKSDFQSEGVPILGIANVGINRFIPGFYDHVDQWKAESLSSYKLQSDDIVIARSGTVGRSCVIPQNIDSAPIMSTNLIRIRIDQEIFLPRLLCCLFNNSSLIERHKHSECRGSSRAFFTQKILLKLQIPVPPLYEQRRIVAYLDSLQAKVDELKKLQIETEKELEELVPSILDKAFKGEL